MQLHPKGEGYNKMISYVVSIVNMEIRMTETLALAQMLYENDAGVINGDAITRIKMFFDLRLSSSSPK